MCNQTVNSILERNSRTTPVSAIKFEGQLSQQTKLEVEFFNEHFVNVSAKLTSLRCSKSPGTYKVPLKVRKDAIDALSLPLALIFNRSLLTGTFPKMWNVPRVRPISKSCLRTEMNNYRQISALTVFSILHENIVHDQIYDFIKELKISSADQFAFQKMHNAASVLY